MEVVEIQPYWFLVQPLPGENELTVGMMGKITGLGGAIARWEKFRFNPPPSEMELEKLAQVIKVDVSRLREMLPPPEIGMKMNPIRLCKACYGEKLCHKD